MKITKFNKTELLFNDNERFEEFKTLRELFVLGEKVHQVKGVYTYNSTYGKGCFIKSNGYNVSLPSHMVNTIEEIRNDLETVEEINDGTVGIEIYSYTLPDKYPDKIFYSINFIEWKQEYNR